MSELDDARKLWLTEEARYNAYAKLIADDIRDALQPLGCWFDIGYRAKTIDSLLKKLMKKPNHTYASLPDKAGVRVVVRYRSDLSRVVAAVQAKLHCGPIEQKGKVDTVGYVSIHADFVRLPDSHPEQKSYPVNAFWVELQLRTLAQHLWSEMSHDSIYKSDETIQSLSEDVKRRVNLMAGQIEVADREFDRLAQETQADEASALLRFLEHYYYAFTSRRPDVELSLEALRTVLPLYHDSLATVEQHLANFINSKRPFLEKKFEQAQVEGALPSSPLLFQPEMLLLYERLSDDQTALRRIWSERFPEQELANLANDLGISFH